DEPQIGEISVESGGGTLARLLNGMDRKVERDAAAGTNSFAYPLGKFQMMAIAGREVRARLGDTDKRLARLQLLPRKAVIEISLEIERCHSGVGRIIEPLLGSKSCP